MHIYSLLELYISSKEFHLQIEHELSSINCIVQLNGMDHIKHHVSNQFYIVWWMGPNGLIQLQSVEELQES